MYVYINIVNVDYNVISGGWAHGSAYLRLALSIKLKYCGPVSTVEIRCFPGSAWYCKGVRGQRISNYGSLKLRLPWRWSSKTLGSAVCSYLKPNIPYMPCIMWLYLVFFKNVPEISAAGH